MSLDAINSPDVYQREKKRKFSIIFSYALVIILSVIATLVLTHKHEFILPFFHQSPSPTSVETRLTLPTTGMYAYSRCSPESRQPKSCAIYISGVTNPVEMKVATITFPTIQHADTNQNLRLNLHGMAKGHLIYGKYYWVRNSNKSQTNYNELGSINLATGRIHAFYNDTWKEGNKTENSNKGNTYISGMYVDREVGRVFYTTQTAAGSKSKLYIYTISSNTTAVINDEGKIAEDARVMYVDHDNVYLAYFNDYVTGKYAIENIYNLKSKTLTPVPGKWERAKINPENKKVAYLDKQELSDNRYSIALNVADLDGTNVQTIYTIPSTRIIGDGYDGSYPYTTIDSYRFNTYGDSLLYSVHKTMPENGRYQKLDNRTYVTQFAKREQKPGVKRGILLPPNSDSFTPSTKEVVPPDTQFTFVKYNTNSQVVELEDGYVFKRFNDWYIAAKVSDIQKLDADSTTRPLAINAQELVFE